MAVKRGIRMQCSECKEINYLSKKNAKNVTEKLSLHKYCKRCQQATTHNEIKAKK